MSYIIIVIILAFVLAPVFWIMPSPAQKRQIQLREKAMALGFQIKLCDLPQSHRASVRKEAAVKGVVYRLHWRHPLSGAELFHVICQRQSGDQYAPEQADSSISQILSVALEQQPAAVVALEYANSGVAVYWREQGGVEMVEQLHGNLLALQQQLAALGKTELEAVYQ